MAQTPWWHKGIKFQCQGSGNCCVSRGEYGYVYLTRKDRIRFARHLGIPTGLFTRQYCDKTDGIFHLKEDNPTGECQFLKDNKCSVYPARPTQCRTWPFWPEVMYAKTWKKEVKSFCPGVGKGPSWSKDKIQNILDEQEKSEENLGT